MEYSILWDRRDEKGIAVPFGQYTAIANVELTADDSPAPLDTAEGRVERIVQTSSTRAPFFAGAFPENGPRLQPRVLGRLTQTGQDPAFPFNHYYGTLHTQTSYSDGGHTNNSTCAASTTHQSGDFTPVQAYSYARDTALLDFLGISDHNHQFNDACTGCSAAQVVQRYHDGLAGPARNFSGQWIGKI